MTYYSGPPKVAYAPRPFEDETLFSWFERLAIANRTDRATILSWIKGETRPIFDNSVYRGVSLDDIRPLAQACDLADQAFEAMIPIPDDEMIIDTVYCHACWQEDLNKSFPHIYTRRQWCGLFDFICDRHGDPLLDYPENMAFDRHRELLAYPVFFDDLKSKPLFQKRVAMYQSLSKTLVQISQNQNHYQPLFEVLETINKGLEYNVKYTQFETGDFSLKFTLSNDPTWKDHWNHFFRQHCLYTPHGVAALRSDDNRRYRTTWSVAQRRYYFLATLSILAFWGKKKHPFQVCFPDRSWAWLEEQSTHWSASALKRARNLAKLFYPNRASAP